MTSREEVERSIDGLKRFDSGDRIVELARNLGKFCLHLLEENERLEKELALRSEQVIEIDEHGKVNIPLAILEEGTMKHFPVLPYHVHPREQKNYEDCPKSIDWELLRPHRRQVWRNHGQTLTRLAQRGGLSPDELVAVLEDRCRHSMSDQDSITRLKQLIEQMTTERSEGDE